MSATNFASNANMTTIMTAIGEKFAAINGAYVYRGSLAFANLPVTLTKAMTGYVYNVTDDFTTDDRFIDGAGKVYPAGTNIAVANIGTDADPVMKFDVVSSFVDVAAITNKILATQGLIAGAFDATASYAVGAVVVKDDVLYKCTTAHTGAWDANDFAQTTVETLIADAEPSSLTTAQVEALIALL